MKPVARTEAERRGQRRLRTLKGGKIVLNAGHSTIDCTVRNLSPSGALLEVQSVVGIPGQFDIIFDNGATRHTCTVRWRTQRLLGVHFVEAAQKEV